MSLDSTEALGLNTATIAMYLPSAAIIGWRPAAYQRAGIIGVLHDCSQAHMVECAAHGYSQARAAVGCAACGGGLCDEVVVLGGGEVGGGVWWDVSGEIYGGGVAGEGWAWVLGC